MTKINSSSKPVSSADKLQIVVDDILSAATLSLPDEAIRAAKELKLDLGSVPIDRSPEELQVLFDEAIKPIKAALVDYEKPGRIGMFGSGKPTAEQIQQQLGALKILDDLIAIQDGRPTADERQSVADDTRRLRDQQTAMFEAYGC